VERFSEGQAAVRVVQGMLGAKHGPGAAERAAAGLRLLESVAEARAFRASGCGALAVADLVMEAAQA